MVVALSGECSSLSSLKVVHIRYVALRGALRCAALHGTATQQRNASGVNELSLVLLTHAKHLVIVSYLYK